jgi:hypothetical protein
VQPGHCPRDAITTEERDAEPTMKKSHGKYHQSSDKTIITHLTILKITEKKPT